MMSCIIVRNDRRQGTLLLEYLSEKGFGPLSLITDANDLKREAIKSIYKFALIDMVVDGENGFELARTIKKLSPKTHCIMCVPPSEFKLDYLIRFDISGYLPLQHSFKEVIECFNLLQEGYRFMGTDIREKLSPIEQVEEKDFSGSVPLTKKEQKILELLVSGKNTNEIAKELFISIHTINNHKTKMKHKLHLSSNRQLVFYAMRNRMSILV